MINFKGQVVLPLDLSTVAAAEKATVEAARLEGAAAAATKAAAAAAMGINWQSKMLACIARGSLPTTSENQVSSYVLRASKSLEDRIFFADSQASLCSLGVPSAEQEMKRDALKILRTLGEYMGLVNVEHRDKCQYFPALRIGGAGQKLNWFVIAGSSVEAFKGAAQEAAFWDLRELTKRVSESKVDKKSLASAINVKMPLNCIACTQPLLSADDTILKAHRDVGGGVNSQVERSITRSFQELHERALASPHGTHLM